MTVFIWETTAARESRDRIFDAIVAERYRQNELHPTSDNLPDGTGGSARHTWMVLAKNACDRAEREGRLTFAEVFDEESSEVLIETDKVKLRKELVQTAAVCVRWIEKLDREAAETAGE